MRHLFFGLALAALVSSPANAEEPCGKHADIVARLESGYEEHKTSMGLSTLGSIIEVYVSKVGTFTIVHTTPDGITCMMAAGDSWLDIQLKESKGPAY